MMAAMMAPLRLGWVAKQYGMRSTALGGQVLPDLHLLHHELENNIHFCLAEMCQKHCHVQEKPLMLVT